MKALALALALGLATPVEATAHCYSIWKYPSRQRCETHRPPVRGSPASVSLAGSPVRIAKRAAPALPPSSLAARALDKPGPSFDIPLTDPDPAKMALRALLTAGRREARE